MAKKILVVDDNKETVLSLNFALEKCGYEVAYAYDGQEGYMKALEMQPDLILLDIMMPVMDGYAMNRHLRENPDSRHIPVLVITAKQQQSASEGHGEGICAFIPKPFGFKELHSKIQEILKE